MDRITGKATLRVLGPQTSLGSAKKIRSKGAKTNTPTMSPSHQRSQVVTTAWLSSPPTRVKKEIPTDALTRQLTGPASRKKRNILPASINSGEGPRLRRTRYAPREACREAPMAIAQTKSAIEEGSNRLIFWGLSQSSMLTAPRKTPGTTR